MSDINLPLSSDAFLPVSPDGDVVVVAAREALLRDVAAVCVTQQGAILHAPAFGASLSDWLEEPDTPTSKSQIQSTLRAAILRLPDVQRAVVKVTSTYPAVEVSVTVFSQSTGSAEITVVL